jgi:hypothetical protein
MPDLDAVRPKLLEGDAPEGIWDALVGQANVAGFEVIRDQKRTENGYCDFLKKELAVRPDVTPAQALKTLVHELGHALLHGDDVVRSREIQEVEVESVAYIVCDALGLDTSDYSFSYVEKIKETGERAVECARKSWPDCQRVTRSKMPRRVVHLSQGGRIRNSRRSLPHLGSRHEQRPPCGSQASRATL